MKVKKIVNLILTTSIFLNFSFSKAESTNVEPTEAKSAFITGEGYLIPGGIEKNKSTRNKTQKKEKVAGISYKILLLNSDGNYQVVDKERTFSSGDRIKIIVKSNTNGYLNIINVGPTNTENPLVIDRYIEPHKAVVLPDNENNFVFSKPAGTEQIFILLSKKPLFESKSFENKNNSPDGNHRNQTSMISSNILSSNIPKGAKNIVLDSLGSEYEVMSFNNNRPTKMKSEKILVQSDEGVNYGVIRLSNFLEGSILKVNIKLKHVDD